MSNIPKTYSFFSIDNNHRKRVYQHAFCFCLRLTTVTYTSGWAVALYSYPLRVLAPDTKHMSESSNRLSI